MIDPFVLLTPVLLLGVIALLRFVGCDLVFKIYGGPTISNIEPNSLTVCGGFTVSGSGFNSDASVQWNLTPLLTTHFVSDTQLEVDVDLALGDTIPNTAQVTVVDPFNSSSPFTYNFGVTPGVPNEVSFRSLPAGVLNDDPVDPINGFENILFPGWQWFTDPNPPNQTAIYFIDVRSDLTFTFLKGPRILQSITLRHFTPGLPAITITLLNDKGESVQPPPIPGGEIFPEPFPTGWQQCSQSVTITLDTPSDQVGIVDLTYLGPV